MAYVIAALGFQLGAFDARVLSVMIFVTFLVNIFTSVGLKLCAPELRRLGSTAHLLFDEESASQGSGQAVSASTAQKPARGAPISGNS